MASIGLLAAGVAHEVNTPLTGISSYTQMLLENADPQDPKTAILEKIERHRITSFFAPQGLEFELTLLLGALAIAIGGGGSWTLAEQFGKKRD